MLNAPRSPAKAQDPLTSAADRSVFSCDLSQMPVCLKANVGSSNYRRAFSTFDRMKQYVPTRDDEKIKVHASAAQNLTGTHPIPHFKWAAIDQGLDDFRGIGYVESFKLKRPLLLPRSSQPLWHRVNKRQSAHESRPQSEGECETW